MGLFEKKPFRYYKNLSNAIAPCYFYIYFIIGQRHNYFEIFWKNISYTTYFAYSFNILGNILLNIPSFADLSA